VRTLLKLGSKPKFIVFFLLNDEEESVKVEEVEEVNFETIKRHLKKGESVFITPKHPEQNKRATKSHKQEIVYSTHI
jgi:hypothetical protein